MICHANICFYLITVSLKLALCNAPEYSYRIELSSESNINKKIWRTHGLRGSLRRAASKSEKHIKEDYKRLVDLNNFEFVINEFKTCCGYRNGPLVIILIHSAPSNWEKRAAIRDTWGMERKYTRASKVLFMFGTTNDRNLSRLIEDESEEYGDVIQGNFVDSYRNMTYKHIMVLKWVFYHCPGAKFVLKTDDDVFINIKYLLKYLMKKLMFGVKDLILCREVVMGPVIRDVFSKHYVSQKEYPQMYYPRYCKGAVILYSADVISKLMQVCQNTPYFFIDDVHVTGTCAKKIGLRRERFGHLKLTSEQASKLVAKGRKSVGYFITGPFNRSPDSIRKLWNWFQRT